jgi:hypothetical protein
VKLEPQGISKVKSLGESALKSSKEEALLVPALSESQKPKGGKVTKHFVYFVNREDIHPRHEDKLLFRVRSKIKEDSGVDGVVSGLNTSASAEASASGLSSGLGSGLGGAKVTVDPSLKVIKEDTLYAPTKQPSQLKLRGKPGIEELIKALEEEDLEKIEIVLHVEVIDVGLTKENLEEFFSIARKYKLKVSPIEGAVSSLH